MAWPTGVTLRTCSFGPDFGIVSGSDYGCDIVVSISRPSMTWGATGSGGVGDTETLTFVPGQEVSFQLPVTDQAGWYIGGLPVDLSNGKQSHVYGLTIKPWIYNSLGRKTFSNTTLTLSNLAIPTGTDPLDLDMSVAVPGAQGGTVTIPDLLASLQASVDAYKTELEAVAAAPTDSFVADRINDPTSETTAALNAAIGAQTGRGIHIRAFGAKGDGTTNDTAAIQAAIDAAQGPLGSGVVFLPNDASTYLVTAGMLTVDQPQVTLMGTGPRAEYTPVIKATGAGAIIKVTGYGCTFSGINFTGDGDANGSTFAPAVTYALDLDRSDGTGSADLANLDHKVKDCGFSLMQNAVHAKGRNVDFIDNLVTQCASGFVIDQYSTEECRGFRFTGNRFHSIGLGSAMDLGALDSWCIQVTSDAAFDNQVSGNYADSSCRGFYRGGLDRTMITGNECINMVGSFIEALPTPNGATWWAWSIVGNTFFGSYNLGWTSTDLAAAKSTPDYFLHSSGGLGNGMIGLNNIARTRKDAISLAGLSETPVIGNAILDAAMYHALDGQLYDGINIAAGSGVSLTGNKVRSTSIGGSVSHRYAINVNASTNGKATGNIVQAGSTDTYNATSGSFVIEDNAAGMSDVWLQASGAQTWGSRFFKRATAGAKVLFGAFQITSVSDASGTEKASAIIKVAGGAGVLINALVCDYLGNITVLNSLGLTPTTSANIPNNAFYANSADSLVKYKDSSGSSRTIAFGLSDQTGNLTSAAAAINTVGKYAGKQVFNTTLNKPVWATGSTATSTWVDATGTVVHAPA